jgi:competence protein ComEA
LLRASPDAPDPGPAANGWSGEPDAPWTGDVDGGWAGDGGRAGRLRIDPGLPGVRVLAAAGLLAALLAGAYLWWSRPEPRPAPAPIVRPAAQSAIAPSAGGGTPSPSQSPLVVDVAGKVRHPGVVSLPPGARVIDAIKEAGGVRPGTKTGTLNLARRVVDGEQILVGVNATPAPALPPAGTPGSPGTAVPGTPLDLNSATATQLDQLPGVGPVLAQRIVDYRTEHGGFRSVDELRQVSGIGDAKYADIKSLVRI